MSEQKREVLGVLDEEWRKYRAEVLQNVIVEDTVLDLLQLTFYNGATSALNLMGTIDENRLIDDVIRFMGTKNSSGM